MMLILLGQYNIARRKLPVYAKRRIIPGYGTLGRRHIRPVALVLENSLFAQDGKAMGKTARHKELAVILSAKFYCDMLSESR